MDKGKNILEYEDEEDEPLVIEGTVAERKDDRVVLCLLRKLYTNRSYSTYGLIETMTKLWNPTKGMVCRELGSNLLSLQFNCKRDMKRVMDMEPWQFNKHFLVLKRIIDDVQPSMMEFNTAAIWIRLYDILPRG